MRIGVSSQNFRTITGHASKARSFLVYEAFIGQPPREVERIDLPMDMSMHAWNRVGDHPLLELDYLITGACGKGFISQMAHYGVQVKATDETDPLVAVKRLLGYAR